MYISALDKCISSECPRYKECYRAQRDAERLEKHYSVYAHCAYASTDGEHDEYDMYLCGEQGDWRMFLPINTPDKRAELLIETIKRKEKVKSFLKKLEVAGQTADKVSDLIVFHKRVKENAEKRYL